jgi:hypothetical protein
MNTEVESEFGSPLNEVAEVTIFINIGDEVVAVDVPVIIQRYQPFPTFSIRAVVLIPTEPTTPLFKS